MAGPRLCLGVIVGAHGLRGQVKVKSFTEDPADLAAYGPLSDVTGSRTFTLSLVGRAKGTLLASIVGVTERNAAEALRGTELFVAREALPDTEDEEVYYHADLIGLTAEDESGMRLGEVTALHNHGAGDLIEIAPEAAGGKGGPAILLPFTRAVVPEVDLANRRLVVAPPPETVVRPDGDPGEEQNEDRETPHD